MLSIMTKIKKLPRSLLTMIPLLAPAFRCSRTVAAFACGSQVGAFHDLSSAVSLSRKRPEPLVNSISKSAGLASTVKRRMTTLSGEHVSGALPAISAEEAEADLEGLDLPPPMAAWVDRLPTDLLDAIDIIEGAGGGVAWIVGGCVRDCLSGLQPWEIDMASTLHPSKLLELFPRALDTGSQYGTVTIRKGGVSVECTTLRADGEYTDGRRPDAVTFGRSLREDLARRDFTINAMAVSVRRRRLFDPFNGRADVAAGVLRAVGDAEARLREDGLRALRAYRFMDGKRGLRAPDPALAAALAAAAPALLRRVSRERVWAELRKILAGPRAATVLDRMAADTVLPSILHPSAGPGARGLRAIAALRPEDLPLWSRHPDDDETSADPAAASAAAGGGDAAAAGDAGGTAAARAEGWVDEPDPLERPQPPARPQAYTHLAFLDLEATCDDRRGFAPSEVIELPVVLMETATGRVVSEFRTFVRPRVHPVLTDFCRELTGITQAQVDAAPSFPEALARMTDWLNSFGLLPPEPPLAAPPGPPGTAGAAAEPAPAGNGADAATPPGKCAAAASVAAPAAGATATALDAAAVGGGGAGGGSPAAGPGGSVLFVTDGDWDLKSMMPKQCDLSGVPLPAVLHRWADVRAVYAECRGAAGPPPKGLIKMCQALGLRFVGPAHSGIYDARNIARVAAALLRGAAGPGPQPPPAAAAASGGGEGAAAVCGAVFRPTSQIKALGPTGAAEADAAAGGGGGGAQETHEQRTARTVCARVGLLLGAAGPAAAEAALRALKVSREEVRDTVRHVRLLGRPPAADDPGQLRRYRAVLGPALASLQLRLDAAWEAAGRVTPPAADGTSGGKGGGEETQLEADRVAAALAALPPLRAAEGAEPLLSGEWIMAQTGSKPGRTVGRLKDMVHFLQVDRDLPDAAAAEAAFWAEWRALEALDPAAREKRIGRMPKLQWPPE